MLSNQELFEELKRRLSESDSCQKLLDEQNLQMIEMNKKLADAESLKSHFISNITNEIVNPFASILGLSKNIIAAKNANFDKIKSMAELIHSEAFELDFQLKNIFTAARIEAGFARPDIIKTEISQLITSIISTYTYKAEQKQLNVKFTFEVDENIKKSVFFNTDPEKLKLIISNLLNNSIKYSNAASRIELKGWIENNNLYIAVKDYGIGIEKKDLEIIFDRFKRLDNSIHSHNPGHGLGLSITKALLDTLDGKIDIKSKRNTGSVFTITIPEGEANENDGFAIDGNEFIFDDTDNEVF